MSTWLTEEQAEKDTYALSKCEGMLDSVDWGDPYMTAYTEYVLYETIASDGYKGKCLKKVRNRYYQLRKKQYEDEAYIVFHMALNHMAVEADHAPVERLKCKQLRKDAEQCIQERDNKIACDAESLKVLRKKVKFLEKKHIQYLQEIDNVKDKNMDYYQQLLDLSVRLKTKSEQLMRVNKELDKNLEIMKSIQGSLK